MNKSMLSKIKAVEEEAKYIGDFLDWLIDVKQIRLHQTFPDTEEIRVMDIEDVEDLMIEYFGIDREQLETEQRAAIDALRERATLAQEKAGDYIKIISEVSQENDAQSARPEDVHILG